mmetsp:Transcript_11125/g.23504  ORF Transcript_11125/g.23504 Transcript_11125/m.23504 type:complete len:125 (-) Transcript_11125:1397-1771(-)
MPGKNENDKNQHKRRFLLLLLPSGGFLASMHTVLPALVNLNRNKQQSLLLQPQKRLPPKKQSLSPSQKKRRLQPQWLQLQLQSPISTNGEDSNNVKPEANSCFKAVQPQYQQRRPCCKGRGVPL